MINRIMNNKLYLISIIIIIFVFLSSAIIGGCKIQVEAEDKEEVTAQIEEVSGEESGQAEEKVISEVNDISVEEVYEIISSNQDYIILDVRAPDEFKEGHIEGAILIPVLELDNRLGELPKDKPIITYCKIGIRSRNAANILVKNGFTQIYDMGGILDWIDKGYPVIKEGETITDAEVYTEIMLISVDESYEFFYDEDYIFLDVRSLEEYKQVHIEGAILIHVPELEDRLDEIPEDKHIIVYCDGAGCSRSGKAAVILVNNGFEEVYDMIGEGIIEWQIKGYPVIEEE